MPKVFASYYIVYVGIVVASVTAPAYEKQSLGSATFWFGLMTLIILLVLVTYRYVKFKEFPHRQVSVSQAMYSPLCLRIITS